MVKDWHYVNIYPWIKNDQTDMQFNMYFQKPWKVRSTVHIETLKKSEYTTPCYDVCENTSLHLLLFGMDGS